MPFIIRLQGANWPRRSGQPLWASSSGSAAKAQAPWDRPVASAAPGRPHWNRWMNSQSRKILPKSPPTVTVMAASVRPALRTSGRRPVANTWQAASRQTTRM